MAEGVLHCARADGFYTGRDGSGAVTLREQEENRDGVGMDVLQVGPDSLCGAELLPNEPRARGRGVAMERLMGIERCRNSAPITAEVMLACSVNIVQDIFWG
jgi:hypothetical protein